MPLLLRKHRSYVMITKNNYCMIKLKKIEKDKDISLNLKYSQNYLVNNNLVKKLVESFIDKDDDVIEIGPGKGIITKELVKKSNSVIAIELDNKLYNVLNEDLKFDNLRLINGNFLEQNISNIQKYKIFSNIPFQITSKIINKITNYQNHPIESLLIIQKEAAKKYMGLPYQKYESMRSLLLKPNFDMFIRYNFDKMDFHPIPDVDIVLFHIIEKKPDFDNMDYINYRNFITYIYNSKGVCIKEKLGNLFSYQQIKRLSKDLKINLNSNYTSIEYCIWKDIFEYYKIGVADEKKIIVNEYYKKYCYNQNKLDKQYKSHKRKSKK